jgi:hypothetical protein
MRASYVVADEHLTRVGQWLAERMPHVDRAKPAWWFDKDSSIFRIFGLKPFYRLCLFDYTRVLGKTRIAIFGVTLINV